MIDYKQVLIKNLKTEKVLDLKDKATVKTKSVDVNVNTKFKFLPPPDEYAKYGNLG